MLIGEIRNQIASNNLDFAPLARACLGLAVCIWDCDVLLALYTSPF